MTDVNHPAQPTLRHNALHFPDCRIAFQRTLRVPDDGKDYPLPPGLGLFPIVPVNAYADRVPPEWRERGGVFIPMHQREALWISFIGSNDDAPSAVKVGIGKVNAVTGDPWDERLHAAMQGKTQDYLVVPDQPWLDGINVGDGRIRQFVAVPLGSDYTVEAQVTGEETWGGIQLLVVPGRYRREPTPQMSSNGTRRSLLQGIERPRMAVESVASTMGMGAGGQMRQKIYPDSYGIDNWLQERASRVFVHIANAELFTEITGKAPPPSPISAQSYSQAGLPWFDLYDSDRDFVAGSDVLKDVWSVEELDEAKIGPAVLKDSSIDLGEHQVHTIGDGEAIHDGDW
jgi:hypothetical protein